MHALLLGICALEYMSLMKASCSKALLYPVAFFVNLNRADDMKLFLLHEEFV